MTQRYSPPDATIGLTDELIQSQIPAGMRVLDLGCGDGRLLEILRDEQQCDVLGVELDPQQVIGAIERGVPILRADLDDGVPDLPSDSFDCAVLSQTLQQVRHPKLVLQEMLRVARRALVVVPNFGHWKVRLQVVLYGRTPVTDSLPYEWYNTPNLHFLSMHDFRVLARRLNFEIVRELPIIHGKAVDRAWLPNLRAESALYVLERGRNVQTPASSRAGAHSASVS